MGGNAPLPPPDTPGKLSVLEELTGGGRVICLFLFSKNRQMTRELPMDHGSSVYGSGVPKPEEDELEEVNKRVNKRCDTIPGGRPGPGASESIFPIG